VNNESLWELMSVTMETNKAAKETKANRKWNTGTRGTENTLQNKSPHIKTKKHKTCNILH